MFIVSTDKTAWIRESRVKVLNDIATQCAQEDGMLPVIIAASHIDDVTGEEIEINAIGLQGINLDLKHAYYVAIQGIEEWQEMASRPRE